MNAWLSRNIEVGLVFIVMSCLSGCCYRLVQQESKTLGFDRSALLVAGVCRPPRPIGVILVDRRSSQTECYVMEVGASTNGIEILAIDEGKLHVQARVDDTILWIGVEGILTVDD